MTDSSGPVVAAGPLLETKLYVPHWRPSLVARPRLIDLLNRGTERKLTLVSAPAGFGKSTLLTEWVAGTSANERPTAWVSLDENDNDPPRFWTYIIAALQTVQPGVGQNALSLLQSPQPPPIVPVMTTLINEIAAIEVDFALILDDFHVIDSRPIHEAVDFLLDYLPPRMHVVIATRSDPPLSLARLRARGESTELRASDLRFTPDEAAAFLSETMGLDLTADDVAALETRTEGWIAGLQLAALSMRGRADIPGFIQSFAGDHRYIVDYLVDEVLQRQTEHVRSFLLQTSILDRLSGPLCDAITGREDGKEVLVELERSNLFVVPLDDTRQWFRYHHLFADVLQAHATEEEPDGVPLRHQRASVWYERNNLLPDAVRHALAAEDFERAADLAERAWRPMERMRRSATWLGWVTRLPDDQVRARPVLSLAYAWALLDGGELEAAEARLRDAERWLDATASMGEMIVVDEEEFRHLQGSIASARAYLAQALGDVDGTVSHARRALDLFPDEERSLRGSPAALLAMASWASGDLETAERTLVETMANVQQDGNVQFVITGTFVLAEIRRAQGRLHSAFNTYQQSLQLAAKPSEPVRRGTANLYTGLSELHREWNNLDTAQQCLLQSKEIGEDAGLPHWPYRWYLAQARIQMARGDLRGALELLDEAERTYVKGPVPDVRPIPAWKARVWIAQGRLTEALDWTHERGLSVDDDLSYLGEFEHMTLARALMAQHKSEGEERFSLEALGLLERLLRAAEDGRRNGSVIEILLLQALAHGALGSIAEALVPLKRALMLSEPEGYVRVFVDEGEAMRDLLCQVAARGISETYARRLISAFDLAQPSSPADQVATSELVEALTPREIEILRLIAAGLRNQEIADELFISLATVKRHIANTYGKLGVSHRTEALARANELSLL